MSEAALVDVARTPVGKAAARGSLHVIRGFAVAGRAPIEIGVA